MLYVFHVDTGTMMTFDINLALESVVTLKLKIEKVCDIPASSQVLLVSGGEVLRHEAKVCSYSAGTDTNPIYMFSKNIIESSEPPRSSCDYASDVDLRNQVETCISMAANNSNYSTVVACSQLAQQFWEHAREHTHVCEKLVHDQHLQQQGWAAVVANMEDVTSLFQRRAEDFEQKFREHLKKKDEYSEFLSKFNEDLETLSSIPILPALRLNAVSNPFHAFDDLHADSESYSERHGSDDEDSESKLPDLEDGQKEPGVQIQTDIQGTTGSNDGSSKTSSLQGTVSEGDEDIDTSHEGAAGGDGPQSSLSRRLARGRGRQSTREALTLLHWITAKENQESLRDIAKYCKNALELLDDSVMLKLQTDVGEAMTTAGQEGMKKIKGLEERLSGLEHLMIEARRIEQEQKDLAFSFVQNQQKAANLGDVSVLRMLCESHCQQLQSMLKNQHKLKDVRVRCARAKEELAVNLYHRLKWIVYVENCMFETDSCLMFYHRSLTRLKKHLGVISQLHKAPKLFCTAVHEIVRRRTFSQAFLAWASDLARHLLTIHSEEVTRRRTFNSLFSGHFLGGLLPGTEDVPPPFATVPPPDFDTRLPRLTPADLQTLAARMPNLSPEIPPYDMTSVTQFFTIRSPYPGKSVEPPLADERILAVVREAAVDRGVESETDTEEFEKVGQSPMFDRSGGAPLAPPAATLAPPAPCDASTLTEENLGSQREEVQNLKELLTSVSNICTQSICVLRDELGKLKTDSADNQEALKSHCNEILSAWDKCNSENAIRERETLQRLTVDHELEMNDIKQTLTQRDEQIYTHKLDFIALENKYSQMLQEMTTNVNNLQDIIKIHEDTARELNKKLEEFELAKQKSIKELQEKMSQEFKAEVESMRSRFRLVALTSMDRSPSESSLEKIERPDMIEITNHKAILQQTKEDMEIEREEAIKLALEQQEQEWNIKLAEEFERVRFKKESEKQINFNEAVRRIIDEKDRQLDQSRERESILLKECMKYKETIQQLADPETSDFQSNTFLQARLDMLEAEKSSLEQKLSEKPHLISTAVKEQQTDNIELKDSSTNPDSKSRQRSKYTLPVSLPASIFSSTSCSNGETVLIVWDQEFNNFSVLQDSPSLFLLHIDCLTSLDLKVPSKEERKMHYYIGKVDNKDYCIAVKIRNRYNVPVGSRFYRVKVRPLKPAEILDKDLDFCCNISLLKEKESSHSRSSLVGGMSVSAMVGGSSNSSKRESPMTKSVCMIRSESAVSTTRRSDETIIISEETEEHARSEQPDSIEINTPDASHANDDQLVPCSHFEKSTVSHLGKSSVSHLEKSSISHLEKSTTSSCNIHLNPLPAPPEESVPYEITKDGRLSEDLISEIAEEAAP